MAAFFDVTIAAKAAFTGASLLWFATTAAAFLRIRQGHIPAHREWMIRSLSLAFFFVAGSLWPPLLAATDLPRRSATRWPFVSWSLNLLAAEWWIRRTRPSHPASRHESHARLGGQSLRTVFASWVERDGPA